MYEQSNKPHLLKKNVDVMQSHHAQDAFQSIPKPHQLHAGVTGRWGLLSLAQNVVRYLALSKTLVEAS